MSETILVIPTYNEAANINELVERIFAQKIPDLKIIIVDDGSPDGTTDIIKELQNSYPIQLIERPAKSGLGAAYVCGFQAALNQAPRFVVQMDADLSHDPADLPRLLTALDNGADMVIGSRKVAGGKIVGWNWRRHLMSNGAMAASRLLLGLRARDVTAGYRGWRRGMLENLDLTKITSNGYAFQEEMLWRAQQLGLPTGQAGGKIVEVPVTFVDRVAGQSKLSSKDAREFFQLIWRLRRQGKWAKIK